MNTGLPMSLQTSGAVKHFHLLLRNAFSIGMILLSFFHSTTGFGQTQLISASNGGFENATSTFSANGWTEVQPANARRWYVGTAAGSVTGGTKAAFVGASNNYNGSNTASVQHFYRDVVIPANAVNVSFSFYLRRPTVDPGDNFYVYRTTTSNTPVAGTVPGAGYTNLYNNQTTTYASFTQMASTNLSALAGTTVRLVFTFQSDGSSPHSNPAVDNITVSCDLLPVITGFNPAIGCANTASVTITGTDLASASAVTIGGTPVSSITSNTATQIVAVVGAGTTGTIAVTTSAGTGTSAGTFTFNPLPAVYTVGGGGGYCSGGSGVSVTLNNSQLGINYQLYRDFIPVGSPIAGTGSALNFGLQTVAGTYTVTAINTVTGCESLQSGSAVVTVNTVPVITTQPVDMNACSGTSVNFTIAATGGAVTYRWRKGTTNLNNGGNLSGVTTNTLTINPVSVSDAASDYNCVVTNACGSEVSDYVDLTVSVVAVAPSAQPTSMTFPTVGVTSIIGSFTASASATNYLVVRTNAFLPPSNPVNGTNYAVGSTALGLGSYVEYNGTGTTFTSNGLNQGTTYYYWVYAFNTSICGTSPVYRTTSPLSGSATTTTNVACGIITTLYWAGSGSSSTNPSKTNNYNTASNWSTSPTLYLPSLVVPGACNNVVIKATSTVTITLNANSAVYDLDFTSESGALAILHVNTRTLTVNGNANIDLVAGAANNSRVVIGEYSGAGAGVVDFKANVRIGINASVASSGKASYFYGNANSKIIFRADLILGRTCVIASGGAPGTIEFDGAGLQQVLWNNDVYFANFVNVVVGNQNSPIVRHVTGTYTPDNILNSLTVNNSSVLDLATSQWIRDNAGGSFSLNGSSRMILANDKSIPSPANGRGVVVPGSNFPGGFTSMTISPNSTVEYDGGAAITQTIWSTPTYGNLVLTNEDGTGVANKINTGTVTVSGTTEMNANTLFTLGADFVSNGSAFVKNGAELQTGTFVVSGSGAFNLQSGGTLGIGSTQGITNSGATGSVRTTTRSFSTGANYIYNGTGGTNTGNGLPTTVNNLTISNGSGVTMFNASATYTVNGILRLTVGSFILNGNTLSIAGLVRNSGTISGSATSSMIINGSNIPLFFTANSRLLKNLTLLNNASASLNTDLDLVAGTDYGTLTVGSGATLNTQNRLTLRSNALGTARIAEIPENPTTGVALGTITGNVTIERFISAQRAWRLLSVPTSGAQTIRQSWQENQPQGSTALTGRGFQISGETFPANGFDLLSTVPSVKKWNGTSYDGITSTLDPIATDGGYMVFIRGDRTINYVTPTATQTILRTSGPVKTGKYPSTAINVPAGQFTAIGNPYASAIDFNMVERTGGVPNIFYVWDPKLTTGPGSAYGFGGFRTITWDNGSGTYVVTPAGGSYTSNTFIESGSAFMVYAPLTSGTINFRESSKTNGSNLVSRVTESNSSKQLRVNIFTFSGGDTVLLDGHLTQFHQDYSNNLDELDALKLSNTGENVGILRNGKSYIVERRAEIMEADTIPFSFGQMKARQYQFRIEATHLDEPGLTAVLEDQFLQTSTPLNLEGTTIVQFSINSTPASYANGRFRVVFRNNAPPPARITNIAASRLNASQIQVQWTVTNENRVSQYELQRSADGVSFRTILFIDPSSNNNTTTNYQYVDNEPFSGINYYRVRGRRTCGVELFYSDTVMVLPGKGLIANNKTLAKNGTADLVDGAMAKATTEPTVNVYPNPVTGKKMNVAFHNLKTGVYQVQLINNLGQVSFRSSVQVNQSDLLKQIGLANTMPAGNYQLVISNEEGQRFIQQVIIR